jgi:hypothetical protein
MTVKLEACQTEGKLLKAIGLQFQIRVDGGHGFSVSGAPVTLSVYAKL